MLNAVSSYSYLATSAGLGYVGWSLLDTGLANTLVLENLRHGTSLKGYLGVKLLGGLPRVPGELSGASQGVDIDYSDSPRGFYVLRDGIDDWKDLTTLELLVNWVGWSAAKRLIARYFATLAGYSMTVWPKEEQGVASKRMRVLTGGVGMLLTILSPTLRARYTFEEMQYYAREKMIIPDQTTGGLAVVFTQGVPQYRFDMIGTIVAAVKNPNLFSRAKKRPMKMVTGMGQLAVAALCFWGVARMNPGMGARLARTLHLA